VTVRREKQETGSGRLRYLALVAIAAVAVVAGVACGDDDNGEPAATATPSAPAGTSTAEPGVVVQVFFLNEENFQVGQEPFVTAVEREVEPPAVAQGALEALFAGPTPDEEAQGLRFEASEATGFTGLTVGDDGIARVQLTGGCSSGGSTFTIAQEIIPTLTQFPSISYVKILDPDGSTEEPEGASNSIPECLEP
jgi:hypothetical protein